jgi:cytochrome c peroxidase
MRPEDRRAINRILSNVTKAIAAYERRLVRGQAPFDRFVAGLRTHDAQALGALSASAQRGLKLFIGRARCIACHSGPEFSDREFHNLGLPARPWLAPDTGRAEGIRRVRNDPFRATGAYSDAPDSRFARKLRFLPEPGAAQQGQFKTPTLRNVALTAPYMHGGHFASLEQVVRFYSTLRDPVDDTPIPDEAFFGRREATLRPLGLSEREVEDLTAFLRSLTGAPLDAALLRPPPAPVTRKAGRTRARTHPAHAGRAPASDHPPDHPRQERRP